MVANLIKFIGIASALFPIKIEGLLGIDKVADGCI